MNQIIPIGKHEFSGSLKQTVNARELHAFLGSKQDFSTWIKNRIDEYGFVENQDFAVFHNFVENPNGGRPRIEYALTLDMAKELSIIYTSKSTGEERISSQVRVTAKGLTTLAVLLKREGLV